jgi:hypothetical protein
VSLRVAEQIADAVLYEGYVLYPYRASAAKNRYRWQVGLVTPRGYAEATGADPWFVQTECLAAPEAGATLSVRIRGLHVQERTIEQAPGVADPTWRAVDRLRVDDRELIAWEEAVVGEFVRDRLPLDGTRTEWSDRWILDAVSDTEHVYDPAGQLAARIVRRRYPVASTVRIAMEEPRQGLVKIRVRVENESACPARALAERGAAMRQSLAGTHAILAIERGQFVSLLDPPPAAAALAASCQNVHTWPVLVGAPGSSRVMLSSPIILYDHPEVAPESPGDHCDATEIDELLMLRVRTLTEEEKREARATDRRAAEIVDRATAASPEAIGRLHGAIRHYAAADDALPGDWQAFLNPPGEAPPGEASLDIGSWRVARGSRVCLRPGHRADSIDLCLAGRTATIVGVHTTLEGKSYVSVTLDDDPFAQAGPRFRRSLFFHPDEIVPLDANSSEAQG